MTNPAHNPLRILVFGATGPTGRHVLAHAQAAGHQVTAFVRHPEALDPTSGLTIVAGDALDAEAVARVMPGHDAVIVALGAPARNREQLRTRAHQIIVDAMEAAGVTRLVSLSSFGVGDSYPQLPWTLRWLVVPLYLKPVLDDHAGQEAIVRASGLSWTLARPPHLTDGPATGAIESGPSTGRPSQTTISRSDLAHFLVDQVGSAAWVHQAPYVCAA